MSEGRRPPRTGAGFAFKVRGPRDFYGGLALIGLAIVAIWASGDLPGTHGFAFGPGTAPRLFAGLLAGSRRIGRARWLALRWAPQSTAMRSAAPRGCFCNPRFRQR